MHSSVKGSRSLFNKKESTFHQLSAITKQEIAKMITVICLIFSRHFKTHKSICHFCTLGHFNVQLICQIYQKKHVQKKYAFNNFSQAAFIFIKKNEKIS